jgi:hypothetical protein
LSHFSQSSLDEAVTANDLVRFKRWDAGIFVSHIEQCHYSVSMNFLRTMWKTFTVIILSKLKLVLV